MVKTIPDVIRIPIDALLEQIRSNETNAIVLVNKDRKAEITRIRVGATDKHYIQVLEGVKLGDTVVVEGKEIRNSGQPIEMTTISTAQK